MALVLLMAIALMVVERSHPLVGATAPAIGLPLLDPEPRGAAALGGSSAMPAEIGWQPGRVLVVDFWASWCPPCRASIPILNRIRSRLAGRSVDFVGVNVEGDRAPAFVRSAYLAFGAAFPTAHDREGRVQSRYRVDSLPTLIVIDTKGIIRDGKAGVPVEEELFALLDSLAP